MIDWRSVAPSDEAELRDFVCTDPPARHPDGTLNLQGAALWELEAQTGIREIQLPLPRGEHLLIGRDDDGIACACWWYEVGGPASVKLLVAAVARRLRRTSLKVGDQLMEEVVTRLIERVDGTEVQCVAAFGLVHPSNGPSQALLARHGFFYVQESGDYQEWWLRIDVPTLEAADLA